MTLQKLELLAMISYAEPKSIYDLANIVGRALAAVQKDCQMLEGIGFIRFEKQTTGRGSIVPKLKFSYNRIVVQLPEHPYSLKIEAA
jgi:predicted transcriptional regulator